MREDELVIDSARPTAERCPPEEDKPLDLLWPAAVTSLLLSALRSILDPVVNNDGVLYLRAAELFRDSQWEAGAALFKWPFYSLTIGVLSSLSGLSVELAAHVVNAALSVVIVVAFLRIVREATCSSSLSAAQARHIEWFAALSILGYSTLNDYRAYIARDIGYLAFFLVALLFLFRYARKPSWGAQLGWGLAIAVATLFRIEGIVFWALLPLALLLRRRSPDRSRCADFLRLHTILLLCLAVVGTALLFPAVRESNAVAGLELEEPLTRAKLFARALVNLPERAAPLIGTVLPHQSADHAVPVLLLSLTYILLFETVAALTPLHLVLVAYAARRRLLFPRRAFLGPWLWSVVLAFTLLLVYVPPKALLTGRYPLAFCLTLLVAVPFALTRLYESWRSQRTTPQAAPLLRRVAFPLAAVLLAVGAVDGWVSFGATKHHLRDAGAWIRARETNGARVFANDKILAYYAGQSSPERVQNLDWPATRKFLEDDGHETYRFVALRIRRRRDEQADWTIKRIGRAPIEEFRNRRGDRVLIFEHPR